MILTILLALLSVQPVELEWNKTWRTDVPYELTIDENKLGKASWQVFADGKGLPTTIMIDRYGKGTTLRFEVPAGTKALSLGKGESNGALSRMEDNVFEGGKWSVKTAVEINETKDGILLKSTSWKKSGVALYEAAVPENCAGKPCRFELDVRSLTKLPFPMLIRVEQYDRNGELLPENVADPRWSTLLMPYNCFTPIREETYLRPDAAKVVLYVSIHPEKQPFDLYGMPLKDEEDARPLLLVSNVALRPAAELPFPSYRDSFFGSGISGEEGDFSLALQPERAFWFNTRSQASWAQRTQIRKESDIFYPSAAGTAEAWFKPDWKTCPKDSTVLFEAFHTLSIVHKFDKGKIRYLNNLMSVSYIPETKTLNYYLKDTDLKEWYGSAKVEIPDGKWFHIAATWVPDGDACIFINGKKELSFPIKGYTTVDLEKAEYPNDDHAMEFYVGADPQYARIEYESKRLKHGKTFFSGNIDLVRLSSGARYTADFTPAKHFEKDADTRALFGFDRCFDGVSGGGIGFVNGTIRAHEDRQNHKVGDIQYYPEELPDWNNPSVVLPKWDREVADVKDFNASEKTTTVSFSLTPGASHTLNAPEKVYMDYVEIANSGNDVLSFPIVLGKGDIDIRSYGDMKETLFDGTETDQQKVDKIFNLLLRTSDYFMNHTAIFDYGTDVPRNVERDPLGFFNSYCGFECGPLNTTASSMFASVGGCASTLTQGYGHTFEHVFYDGSCHLYDLSAQRFFPSMNNETRACLTESEDQPEVNFRWLGSANHFIRLGSRQYYTTQARIPEKFGVNLNPGEKIRFYWYGEGMVNDVVTVSHFKAPKIGATRCEDETGAASTSNGTWRVDRFFPEYGNTLLEFDGVPTASNPAFVNVNGDSFCYRIRSSYSVVAAEYEATLKNGKKAELQISTDDGKTFRPFTSPATYQVRARTGYLIKVCAPISKVKNFRASTEYMSNIRMLPGALKAGENVITLKAVSGTGAKVTYKYREPAREIIFKNAAQWGTIKGCDQSLVVLNPEDGALTVDVSGVSPKATVGTKGGLKAGISAGKIKITSTSSEPHFGWVTVNDGEVSKTLTVLVCGGAQLVRIGKELDNNSITKEMKEIPAGKYAFIALQRNIVDTVFPRDRKLSIKVGKSYKIGSCINPGSDFYKKVYGKEGEKGAWRWQFVNQPGTKYPYEQLGFIPVRKALSKIQIAADGGKPVDVAYVLVVPETTRDFKCDMVKNLCSTSVRPWAF